MSANEAKKHIVDHIAHLLNHGWDGSKKDADMPAALPFAADAGGGQKPASFRVVLDHDQHHGWRGNLFIP